MKIINIGVCDDHPFVAHGIESMIVHESDMEFGWRAGSVEAAVVLLKASPVDVLILDLNVGKNDSDSFGLLRAIVAQGLNTKVLFFSAYLSRHLVREAARCGAAGYFSKSGDLGELVSSMREAACNDAKFFLGPYKSWSVDDYCLKVSPREKEVLMALAKGRTNQEIAQQLGVKVGTVKTHLESIYMKLGVSSRTDAVRCALTEHYFYLEELSS